MLTQRQVIEMILKHAMQGQTQPEFAKNQCWEIEQLAKSLLDGKHEFRVCDMPIGFS